MENKESRPEYLWDNFKGTRNEWAWHWLEFHYLYWAKEDDDIDTEIFCKELLKSKQELKEARANIEKLADDLAGNVCGYCWMKMHNEPDTIDSLKAENERLKEYASEGHTLNKLNWDKLTGIIDEQKEELTTLREQLRIATEVLERLTKVGPPSRSCSGDEVQSVLLSDNCNIAREALDKLKDKP